MIRLNFYFFLYFTILMSYKTSVTPAIAFVDLATFSDLEAYLYGGAMAVTYFVRSVKKANWFSFVPIGLRHVSGTPDFGQEYSASVNRSGDYVLNVWMRVKVPQVYLSTTVPGYTVGTGDQIRWTHNFMHNLIKKVNITFNELLIQEFDNTWLDYNHYFRTTASKRVGYDTMIGEVAAMTTPVLAGVALGTGGFFNLPLPFFFCEDSGVALPVAALPFNDIKINFYLRDWQDLMVTASNFTPRATMLQYIYQIQLQGTTTVFTTIPPKLLCVETMAHYVVIHNDERVLMGKAPRDMHIHQVQILQEQDFSVLTLHQQNSYDLRFSHSVHLLAWGAKNLTVVGEHSMYCANSPAFPGYSDVTVEQYTDVNLNGYDPIQCSTLVYENTARVDMGSDYYSTVVPWYYCEVIPDVTGIHMYSYSLEAFGQDPKGSTGYSKLANVSILASASEYVSSGSGLGGGPPPGSSLGHTTPLLKYRFQLRARNHNIVRLSGGSLGLPIL